MFENYKVAVRVVLVDELTRPISILTRHFLQTEAAAAKLQTRLNTIKGFFRRRRRTPGYRRSPGGALTVRDRQGGRAAEADDCHSDRDARLDGSNEQHAPGD